jgi:hypothetical protein
MKWTKEIAQPNYQDLKTLFDNKYKKIENFEKFSIYQSELRLKVNLRFEMNFNFNAHIYLIKKGRISKIEVYINNFSIILLSLLMFGLMTIMSYFINPSIFSLVFGIISGFIVFFMLKNQIEKELNKYFKKMLIQYPPLERE